VIFTAAATAEQRRAAARARLPTSMAGMCLRSMVTISSAAYVALLRAVAPAIVAASTPAACAALRALAPATEHDPAAVPMLRALAAASRAASALLDEADKPAVALETFCDKPEAGVQRRVTHAAEKKAHADAMAAARPDEVTRAFLNSCNGRWMRTVRVAWLQLSNEETILRMQRYLRLPLSVLGDIDAAAFGPDLEDVYTLPSAARVLGARRKMKL
jgi:hypothetical protein